MAKRQKPPLEPLVAELSTFPADLAVQLQRSIDELRLVNDDGEAVAVLSRLMARLVLIFPEQAAFALVATMTLKSAVDQTAGF